MAASLAAGSSPQQRVVGLGRGFGQGSLFRAIPWLFLGLLGTLAAGGLEQEPAAFLRLIDKGLDQTRGRNVVVLIRDLVRLTEIGNDGLVVVHQLLQHVLCRNKILIVVL